MNSSDFNAFYNLMQRSTLALESIANSLGEMNSRNETTGGQKVEITGTVVTEKSWKD